MPHRGFFFTENPIFHHKKLTFTSAEQIQFRYKYSSGLFSIPKNVQKDRTNKVPVFFFTTKTKHFIKQIGTNNFPFFFFHIPKRKILSNKSEQIKFRFFCFFTKKRSKKPELYLFGRGIIRFTPPPFFSGREKRRPKNCSPLI